MLKIKLVRFGKKNQPHYRIVVQEARTKRDGQYTAKIGHYAPAQHPKVLELNLEEYKKWLTKGAQPTDTVAALAKRFASGKPFPKKKKRLSKKQLAKNKAATSKPAQEKEEDKPIAKKEEKEAAPVKEKETETKSA